jgi:hypothetical protein
MTTPGSRTKATTMGPSNNKENNNSFSRNKTLQKKRNNANNNPNVLSVATASAFLAWSLFSGAALADGESNLINTTSTQCADCCFWLLFACYSESHVLFSFLIVALSMHINNLQAKLPNSNSHLLTIRIQTAVF